MRKDSPRPNVYKLIHKYARSQINQVTQLAGSTDLELREKQVAFSKKFEKLIGFLDDHAHREDKYIHPLMKEGGGEILAEVEKQHKKLDESVVKLRAKLNSIQTKDDSYYFYLDFVQFQSQYYEHLNDEELKLLPVLHKCADDETINTMNRELLASIPGDLTFDITKYMIPAITHDERVFLFENMKKSMPSPAFSKICEVVPEVLSEEEAKWLFKEINYTEVKVSTSGMYSTTAGTNKRKKPSPERDTNIKAESGFISGPGKTG